MLFQRPNPCHWTTPSRTFYSILIDFIFLFEHHKSILILSSSPLSLANLIYSIGPQVSKLLQGDTDAIKWARLQVNALEAREMLDNEASPHSNLQSHINLALLDVEDDSLSMCSVMQSVSLEDYLRGRWSSRSSSFD